MQPNKEGQEFLAKALELKGKPKLANKIRQANSFQEATTTLASVIKTNEDRQTLLNGFVQFIAEQEINNTELGEIFGNLFQLTEDGEITAGSGLNYIESVPNMTPTTDIPDFQAPLQEGETLFSQAYTKGFNITPEIQLVYATNNKSNINTKTSVQIQQTMELTWNKFAANSPQNSKKILDTFITGMTNAKKQFEFSIGNYLWMAFKPLNTVTDTVSQSTFDFMRNTFYPTLIEMKQYNNKWNGYSANGKNWAENLVTQDLPVSITISPNSYQEAVFNNGMKNPILIMNKKTASQFASSLLTPSVMQGNNDYYQARTKQGFLSQLGGIPVYITAPTVPMTIQNAQGTNPTLPTSNLEDLPDGEIIMVDEDYIKWRKLFDFEVQTNKFPRNNCYLATATVGYLPILKPWKNAVVFNCQGIMNGGKLEVITTPKTSS